MTPTPTEGDYFRLRAEWLRFKNHVHDAFTELPTFSAVLDEVRRLMEERGAVLVVYVDLGAETRLEPIYGWQVYDLVLKATGMALAEMRAGVLGPRDIVATMTVRSDKFLLFLRAPEGPPESGGADARVEAVIGALEENLRARLPPGVHDVTLTVGHSLLYRDPMLRAERSIHRALDQAMHMSLRQRTRDEDRRALALDEVIRGAQVVTLYQPIVDLHTRQVLGHEVFSRGPAGGPFEDAERLFALADRTGRAVELERLCRRRALKTARSHLPPGTKLFLNTSSRALRDGEIAGAAFVRQVDEYGLPHEEVVLEITERLAQEDRAAYQQVLLDLKRQGFGIAIDDMGAGYASLQALVEVEPDYLKFDIALVRHIDRNLIKRSLLETLVDLSRKIGARVIAEGIEAEAELRTLRDLGVPLGQGMHLAAPALVPAEGASLP
ncbi:MAG TPA: EAL domain-containing protein [Vicinamibacteria bacterium]|nr:EAL domain-containing protein [Vicinamibacteria bacterium]